MPAESPTRKKQLLHLVLGGELTGLGSSEFKDLDKIDIVGVFPNYASAYVAWKAKAQQTVDNAHMRYSLFTCIACSTPKPGRSGMRIMPPAVSGPNGTFRSLPWM